MDWQNGLFTSSERCLQFRQLGPSFRDGLPPMHSNAGEMVYFTGKLPVVTFFSAGSYIYHCDLTKTKGTFIICSACVKYLLCQRKKKETKADLCDVTVIVFSSTTLLRSNSCSASYSLAEASQVMHIYPITSYSGTQNDKNI